MYMEGLLTHSIKQEVIIFIKNNLIKYKFIKRLWRKQWWRFWIGINKLCRLRSWFRYSRIYQMSSSILWNLWFETNFQQNTLKKNFNPNIQIWNIGRNSSNFIILKKFNINFTQGVLGPIGKSVDDLALFMKAYLN